MEENKTKKENYEICPNCLEPNRSDLANCEFCGMPLHPDAAAQVKAAVSETSTENTNAVVPAPASGEAADETTQAEPSKTTEVPTAEPAAAPKKKENKGWTYAMRGFGLYIIFYAISEGVTHFKLEDPKERRLGLLADFIYLIAGCLMAWPMLKDYLNDRKKKKAEKEKAASEQIIEGFESAAAPADVPSDAAVKEDAEAAETMAEEVLGEAGSGEAADIIELDPTEIKAEEPGKHENPS